MGDYKNSDDFLKKYFGDEFLSNLNNFSSRKKLLCFGSSIMDVDELEFCKLCEPLSMHEISVSIQEEIWRRFKGNTLFISLD